MHDKKFDPAKLELLNNPERLKDIPPAFVAEKLKLKNPEVMVDIGAGTGFFSVAFLQQVPKARVFACDISQIMIDWMKKHVVPHFPDIIPVLTRESTLPLENDMADLVFSINLHHELHEPLRLLKEARRVLKPGGKLLIIDWKKEETGGGPPLHIRYSPDKVKQQLHIVGFREVSLCNDLSKHFMVWGTK